MRFLFLALGPLLTLSAIYLLLRRRMQRTVQPGTKLPPLDSGLPRRRPRATARLK
jgi:hypothetical protein